MRLTGTLWPGPRSCDLEISLVELLSKRGKRSYIREIPRRDRVFAFVKAVAKLLGVVLLESFLFGGTIAENIAFSRPSSAREEIKEACRIAHVNEFVGRLDSINHTMMSVQMSLLILRLSIAGRTNPRADKNNQLAKSSLRISY